MYCELLKSGEIIIGDWFQQQLIHLSQILEEKRPECKQRHEQVIFQHGYARPNVAKTVQKSLNDFRWDVLPYTRLIHQTLPLLIIKVIAYYDDQ